MSPRTGCPVFVAACVGHALSAPLCGRECVYWRVIVEAKTFPNRRNPSGWVVQLDLSAALDFHLLDEQGAVLVKMRGARSLLGCDMSYELNSVNEALDRSTLIDFIETHGTYRASERFRLREYLIEEGDSLHISGVIGARGDDIPRLKIEAVANQPLYLART